MTDPDVRVVVAGADSELDAKLSAELTAFNERVSGITDQREFTVRLVEGDDLVAGLSGWTWGTHAGIGLVWVRDDARHRGWGTRLLGAAEQVARERGCVRVSVSSFTFQAPEFYRRHGYVETGRTEDLPVDGMADVHLVKLLG